MAEQPNTPPAAPSLTEAAMTAEETRELEGVRLKRIEAETRLEELRAAGLVEQKKNAELHQQQNVRAALRESGVKFHDTSHALQLVGEIEFDAENQPYVDGKPLAKALQSFALANESHVDGRSIRALKEKLEDHTPKSKQDFKSIAGKVEFIKANGQAAYEALPLRPPVNLRGKLPNTWAEYSQLSISERARVAGQAGDGFIAELYRKRA